MPRPPTGRTARWIDDQLSRLTPSQKLAQRLLVVPGIESGRPDDATRHALELGVGVLHTLGIDLPASAAARYHNEVARLCADAGLPPALISGNLESGVAYALGSSGTHFPYPRGIGLAGDAELAYRVAAQGAREARSLGYHWTFSPCVDVVVVPDDPILGVRAYGVPAGLSGALGAAQIRGYQEHGVLATAKHFPGHGDSSVDSHLDLPRVNRSRAEHEQIHLPPFSAAVAAGVAAIMVAHLELPALGINEPASLSATVNRHWLRTELEFDGVIVTDALRMDAIARRHDPADAAVLALRAGADVANVKCPAAEAPRIIERLLEALADGTLLQTEVDDSVRRLLLARSLIGLDGEIPELIDEDRAGGFDQPLEWSDPGRASTVSLHADRGTAALSPETRLVVVGESELARRFAELGTRRGLQMVLDAEPLGPGALARVAARHPGEQLLPVFCAGTVPLAQQRKEVESAVVDVPQQIAALVINSAEPAEAFGDLGGRVLTAPAVDAFAIVTDAAIHAAFDVL
ncbi:glycoside hydrolase family 3 N-terminal domain-containing protein [Kribbella sp. CA-293567]|uniref:glycoside hydrolase family 3 N-terminal domain-containing protein n=1 Tax=Kribbella sp. CA-293567 TaxID=3002436 RepID=UPI0022DCF9E2|nr:glycoside hydrolase family 3 N-terminal domain-containing protein [Kribbella sp. CA-293567]WBQ06078.1 hypothetical protein OX958_04550 [Kribbella sp. CA-293567]